MKSSKCHYALSCVGCVCVVCVADDAPLSMEKVCLVLSRECLEEVRSHKLFLDCYYNIKPNVK